MTTLPPTTCCSAPNPWTNNHRWPLYGFYTSHLGVCVNCGQIIDVGPGGWIVALTPFHMTGLRRNFSVYFEELVMEQRHIRGQLVPREWEVQLVAAFSIGEVQAA